jgi:hypothetical protein
MRLLPLRTYMVKRLIIVSRDARLTQSVQLVPPQPGCLILQGGVRCGAALRFMLHYIALPLNTV